MSDIRPLLVSRLPSISGRFDEIEDPKYHHFINMSAMGHDTTGPRASCTTPLGSVHMDKVLPDIASTYGSACDV